MIDLTGSLKLTSKLVLKSLLEISKICELPPKFSSAYTVMSLFLSPLCFTPADFFLTGSTPAPRAMIRSQGSDVRVSVTGRVKRHSRTDLREIEGGRPPFTTVSDMLIWLINKMN